MNIEHKKICIGSDIRSLLYSYFYNYYFIPYQYFHSIPCEYYENIDFVFKRPSKIYERYKLKLLKIIKENNLEKQVYLKSDIEDLIFNTLGNKGQILSFGDIDHYEFADLNKLKIRLKNVKFNVHIIFDECLFLDPINTDELMVFDFNILDENRNNVYFNYQLKDYESYYSNRLKYNHIDILDNTFPQKISYGDYKNQDFKYVTLSGVLTDEQLDNQVLLQEDRLLEYALSNLLGDKEFRKNIGREKQYTKFVGKTVIPFTRIRYLDSDNTKFLYATERGLLDEYIHSKRGTGGLTNGSSSTKNA